MRYALVILLCLTIVNCRKETKLQTLNAEGIIDKSIEVSGGDKFDNSDIKFTFRENSYRATRNNGRFELSRLQIKEGKLFYGFITNDGFKRIVDGLPTKVEDSMATKYSASINSVHYFSVLPYGLNSEAVNKKLLGEETIKEKNYYKVRITFEENGGGEDYEDIFIYWIDKESFKVDYLAYSYNEDDGKGLRFREAYNERYINTLRFVDYNNYKPEDPLTQLKDLGKMFESNQLKLLSKVELENLEVELINI